MQGVRGTSWIRSVELERGLENKNHAHQDPAIHLPATVSPSASHLLLLLQKKLLQIIRTMVLGESFAA